MIDCVAHDVSTWVVGITHWSDTLQTLHWHLPHLPFDLAALDKPLEEPDLWGQVQRAINNFVKTGQVWAMLIGLILGYMIRSFTSYG